MYCFHPINVREWKQTDKVVSTDRFGINKYKSVKTSNYHLVPCGKCVACLSRKRNEWTYRLTMEKDHSDYTYFGTLTYDNDKIPVRLKDNVPYFVFNKSDVQKYMKRVRYFISQINKNVTCSYYLVSEYGKISHRPHYHYLMYIHGDPGLQHKKQIDMILRDTWQNGFITIKAANSANIHYVTKYVVKDLDQSFSDCIDDVFVLASKRPYIGSYHEKILQKQIDYSALDPKVFINGFAAAMPRIYREKVGASGMIVPMSDEDPRLSKDMENRLLKEYSKTHSYFSKLDFIKFCTSKLNNMEYVAKKRQLQRTEKL